MIGHEISQLGESIALTQERLRMPTISKADAMAITGRTTNSSWARFADEFGIHPVKWGRFRRKDVEDALRREARLPDRPPRRKPGEARKEDAA